MNTNERPTPETDAEELHDPYLVRELPFCAVRIDFARRLERERDEARDRITELEKQLAELQEPKKQDTFEAHSLPWIKHTPGNFIPCSGDTVVRVLLREELYFEDYVIADRRAACWNWGRRANKGYEIIGWNYADAP